MCTVCAFYAMVSDVDLTRRVINVSSKFSSSLCNNETGFQIITYSDDSTLLEYDAISLDNQFTTFILPQKRRKPIFQ
jgi:hypothetical protein